MAERKQKTRRKERKNVPVGKAFIASTFNNTIITLTDPNGAVLSWASPALSASRLAKEHTVRRGSGRGDRGAPCMEHGLRQVEVRVKGR